MPCMFIVYLVDRAAGRLVRLCAKWLLRMARSQSDQLQERLANMCNVYSVPAGGVPDLDSRKAKGTSKLRDCDSPNDQAHNIIEEEELGLALNHHHTLLPHGVDSVQDWVNVIRNGFEVTLFKMSKQEVQSNESA
ncbi:hypothetical protein KCV07_g479, partial [Aureobasidium melanogenum]